MARHGALRRLGLVVGIALVGLGHATADALAQDTDWVRSYYNLERSHIDHPVGRGLIFEGQIAPQIIVAQNLSGLFDRGAVTGDDPVAWGYSFAISPMVRLRMINTASQPVRTPSYMPHGVAQLFRVRNLSESSRASVRMRGPFEMWTLQARLSHHSNGQDGCLYTSQVKEPQGDGAFECVFMDGFGPDPRYVNLLDGSFSKNFVRAGLFYRRLYMPEGTDSDRVRWSWYAGGTAETHKSPLVNWMPGTIPQDQETLYGTWRWRLLAGAAFRHQGRLPGGHFLDVVYERYPDAADVITGWSFSAEYIRSFDRYGGWGLYARYFTGQDYYNLGFGRKLARFSIGLAWVQDRFETVGAPPMG